MSAGIHPVWQKHPGLVWSNSEASDAVRIRAALTRPLFSRILDLTVAFGLERIKQEWAYLMEEPSEDCLRAQPIVERIFQNIEKGIAIAAARH